MKIDGYHNKGIAKILGVPLNIIDNVELLAMEAAKRAIEKAQVTRVPIVGVV